MGVSLSYFSTIIILNTL